MLVYRHSLNFLALLGGMHSSSIVSSVFYVILYIRVLFQFDGTVYYIYIATLILLAKSI
jgi:hypothetical protein